MLEVMIERWSRREGGDNFLWSVWRDGSRVQMGGPVDTSASAEEQAIDYCRSELGRLPDRVTPL